MELEFIRWLNEHLPRDRRAPLGLRDDGAIVEIDGVDRIVVTTDLVSDEVDFRLCHDAPQRIGRKALAVNLSDLGAMGAKPHSAVVSIALPHVPPNAMTQLELAITLYEGLIPLAREFGIAIVGGDTNSHDGPLVISITAFGLEQPGGPLTRGGGRPGDWLLVTGQLGGSILGHHFDFTPRVREALLLCQQYEIRAGMDISDGLSIDLARLATDSHCGAVVLTDNVPIAPAARELASSPDDHLSPLEHALVDGEDFELLLAVSPDVARTLLQHQPLECGLTHIGELTTEQGLWRQSHQGPRKPLEPKGWTH